MSTVLITGGTGLLGAPTARQLLEAGHDVVLYDKVPNRANVSDIADDVSLVAGDVTDLSDLLSTLRKFRVERVIHLAAAIMNESARNPTLSVRVNCLGTGNVLDAAVALGLERVCYASTLAVYGDPRPYGDRLLTEADTPTPISPYAATKRVGEVLANVYRESLGLDVVGVRSPLAYGIGRLTGAAGEFNGYVRRAALEGRVTVGSWLGGADARFQSIYYKDMAATFAAATVKSDVPGAIYNAPTSESYSVESFAAILRDLIPGLDIDIKEPAPGHLTLPLCDGSAAQRDLGVVPEYSLQSGIEEMIGIFRQSAWTKHA